MSKIQYGINLNGHPLRLFGRPADPKTLEGLAYVRLVFLLHAAVVSDTDHTNIFGYNLNDRLNYEVPLRNAFVHYDRLIRGYAQYGIRTLLILNQETFAGNSPWSPASDGNWQRFKEDFSKICGKIAAHYTAENLPVDYEVWNEGDNDDPHNEASVFIDAVKFAPVLNATANSIHQANPEALVVFGGVVTGAAKAADYVNKVRSELGGSLPVNVVGFHPYSQKLAQQPAIPGSWAGDLTATLNTFDTKIGEPLWITEIGVSEPGNIQPVHYPAVAKYMRGVYELIEANHSQHVPVVIWFAWSDIMREAGITDKQGQPKEPIYSTFFELARNGARSGTPLVNARYRLRLAPGTAALNVREPDGTKFREVAVLGSTDRVTVLEESELAIAKLGRTDQWMKVRTPEDTIGWVEAGQIEPILECAEIIDAGKAPVPFLAVPKIAGLSVRDGSLTSLPKQQIGGVPVQIRGDEQVAVVEDPRIAYEKVKLGAAAGAEQEQHWIHIRTASGVEGWCAAWHLAWAADSETPVPLPTRIKEAIRLQPPDDGGGAADATDPEAIRRAEATLQQVYGVRVTLASTDEYPVMEQLIGNLRTYGVALHNSHEGAAPWTLAEAQKLQTVVEQSAQQTGAIFKELYGVDNPRLAFRALYSPLSIARDSRGDVHPPDRWYAKNPNSFEVIFGNSCFFAGSQTAGALAGTVRRFNTQQLMAHEISHTINWRYAVHDPAGGTSAVAIYYQGRVETADGLNANSGFSFGAQSSAAAYETVTDAIANFNLNGFTANADGNTRKAQMSKLIKLVVQFRVRDFDQDDMAELLHNKEASYPGLTNRVKDVNSAQDREAIRAWLAALTPVGGGSPIVMGPEPTGPVVLREVLDLTGDYVNVRSGPGQEFEPPIGQITKGSIVPWEPASKTRDQANRFDWVRVTYGALNGWIALRTPDVRFVAIEDYQAVTHVSTGYTNAVLDVSHWQIIDDWQAVFDEGIRGIIHKATQGSQYVDPTYAARRTKAKSMGMLWGAYHFGDGDDPIQQADNFLRNVDPDAETLIALDFEHNELEDGTDMHLAGAERYVRHIHAQIGRFPVLYTGAYLNKELPRNQNTILSNCRLWLAAYTPTEPVAREQWAHWDLWQYTNGKNGLEPRDVKGISRVDRDVFNGSFEQLKAFWLNG